MAKAVRAVVIFAAIVSLSGFATGFAPPGLQGGNEQEQRLWSEFVQLLKTGKITEEHIRPEYTTKAIMLQFLSQMRASALWEEWERPPEVHRVGSHLHFITRLSENGTAGTYSFTFLEEGGRGFLQHFESIVVRLDKIGTLPASTFPDLPEDKKAWMRQENYWSQMIILFRQMRSAAGLDAAFNMFRDGPGYLVQAKTWVPFFPPAKAFILFLCWEQSRLHGNTVTLERLEDTEATVLTDFTYLRLYRQTGHMRRLISEEDYRRIFETIWRDRAQAAGWDIQFSYQDARCTFRFTSKASPPQNASGKGLFDGAKNPIP